MSGADKTYHLCLSVSGYIKGPDKDLRGLFRKSDGTSLTPAEARGYLRAQLHEGVEVLPFGECEGFDFSGGGCPGHTVNTPGPEAAKERV